MVCLAVQMVMEMVGPIKLMVGRQTPNFGLILIWTDMLISVLIPTNLMIAQMNTVRVQYSTMVVQIWTVMVGQI